MNAYIGRQPIFDYERNIVAYELLYRSGGGGNAAHVVDGDAASRSVLSDAVNVFGISELTGGLPAYIHFTHDLLMNDFAFLCSPDEIVVDVPASTPVDDLLLQHLNALRRAGYRIALNGYNETNGRLKFDDIIQVFNIVRVDVSRSSRIAQKSIVNRLFGSGTRLLAQRVESMDDFASARAMGFTLFQGYFFEKPTYLSRPAPPLSETAYGRLFNELLSANPDFDVCARIIHSDPVIMYMFLCEAKTVSFHRGATIKEIKRGLVMMGTEALRRWIGLVLLQQNNVSSTDDAARRAYIRALFIERLMENAYTPLDPRQGFLMGVFSLLDKAAGVSMDSLLREVNLQPELKAALLGGEENDYSRFLQYAVIFEMGNERLILPDIRLRLDYVEVEELYADCAAAADDAFGGTGGST